MKFRAKKAVYFIAYIMILGTFIIWGLKHVLNNWVISASETELIQTRAAMYPVQVLNEENAALREKLERSASYQTKPEVKALSEYYIRKNFGSEADRVIRVMQCESGLDNQRVHTNKDGSKDSGLYQIHDEPTHRRNIEKMYGMPFDLAVFDLEVSTKYALFLWKRNPDNWVCNKLT